MRCDCGAELIMADIKGTSFPWKDLPSVKLLVSFNALTCPGCNEIFIKGNQVAELDQALEQSLRIRQYE